MKFFKKNIIANPEIIKAIQKREMKTENLINKFRLAFVVIIMGIDFINIYMLYYGTEITTIRNFDIVLSIIMFSIITFIHFASLHKKYQPWLKYFTVTNDLVIAFVFVYSMLFIIKIDLVVGKLVFLLIGSIVFLFFNSLSIIRSSKPVVIYSGFLTLILNAGLYILAREIEMPLYYTSSFIIIFTVLNIWVSDHIINFLIVNNKLNLAYDDLKQANNFIQQRNDEIEDKNKQITDSINYASRIQTAMLPAQKLLDRFFPQHFILYKPRDIVSGDFYWVAEVNKSRIIAIADCTGHGVPGAFVSILGISMLNDIIRKKNTPQANQILHQLRIRIKDSLQQTETIYKTKGRLSAYQTVKDGLDIALCIIDTETNQLQFAGANSPLYIIRNQQCPENITTGLSSELIHIKGDRQPIGVYLKELPFTNHEIQIQKGDILYMFSDGFIDQFGGEKAGKFYSKRFQEILLSIHTEPIKKQKQILEQTFNEWKGKLDQIDDVLVMGIRI